MLLGGLGAGLLDFSLSTVLGLALAGVPGALGAGLGAVDGAGLGMGAGLGAALTVGFSVSEPTLPVLAGLTEPSPLAVRGAGLTTVTVRSCIVCEFGWANRAAVLTTVVIEVAAEAINGLGSLTLDSTGGPTHCSERGCSGSSVLRFLHTSRETGCPGLSASDGVEAFLFGEPDLSTPKSSGCVWKEAFIEG